MNVSTRLAALAVLVLALAGCGARRYPVEGVVQFEDGSPALSLARGRVSFESVVDRSNVGGDIRADGTFRAQGPLGQDGAPAGTYRVLVLPPEGADRRNPPIDPSYGRYETSGIEVTVKGKERTTIVVRRPEGSKPR